MMPEFGILHLVRNHRKAAARIRAKILRLEGDIAPAIKQDLTVAALRMDQAIERLLAAETRLEDGGELQIANCKLQIEEQKHVR